MNSGWRKQGLSSMLILGGCLCSIAFALPGATPNAASDRVNCLPSPPTSSPTSGKSDRLASLKELQQLARSFTVKVLAKDVLGSGILIQRRGSVYTVVTNDHVLAGVTNDRVLAGVEPPYRIQTPDDRIYPVETLPTRSLQGKDLALLQFRSPEKIYAVASIEPSSTLAVGDEVFAAGFPFADETSFPRQVKQLTIASGRVSLVLDKALAGGYQIGYTNDVRRGMSGGPLLNRWGEVVGINGMSAHPLWDAPDLYEDGSEPCPRLQAIVARSSWAVPIQVVQSLTSQKSKVKSWLTGR